MSHEITISIKLPRKLAEDVKKLSRSMHRKREQLVEKALEEYILNQRWKRLQQQLQGKRKALRIKTEADVEKLVDGIRKKRQ